MTKRQLTETEKKDLLEYLVDDNPAMKAFLGTHRVTGIPHIDEKCAILFLDGDETYSYKYVIDPSGGTDQKRLNNNLADIMLRGLRCQRDSKDINGVQPIASPTFYEEVTGLVQLTYLHGQNLSHPGEGEQLRDPAEIIRLYEGLGATLEQIHARSIIHRDVKPGNLVLSNKRLWLIDWSIAATRRGDEGDRGIGLYLGTPRYMYFFGDRSRDFYAAGLSLLQTCIPEIEIPRQIRLDTDACIRGLAAELRRRYAPAADLFEDFMTRPPEYPIPLELRQDPLVGWRDETPAHRTITGFGRDAALVSTVEVWPGRKVVPDDVSRSLTTY